MRSLISQVLITIRKKLATIILLSFVFIVAFCIFSYVNSFQTASIILSFKYPNASDGLYPNGTYFNAYNIFTEDILAAAIKNAGLEGRVDPKNLSDEITIRPRSDASLITTQFIVSYNAGPEDQLGAVSAEGLLNSVIYSYINHFHETYRNDQIAFNFDFIDDRSLEYIDLVNYYNISLNQLQKYLRSQQDNNKDFISSDGTSFQDLINIIDQYRTTSLQEIKSIITEQGVTADRSGFTERLEYRIWNYTNSYDYNRKMQQLYKKILQDYEARLTSVVFIPSLDSERKFYMSKTKVGIDIHSLNATKYEEAAEELHRQIRQTDHNINMIKTKNSSTSTPVNTARVETLVTTLREQLDATMEKIQHVEKEYSQYKNHNYVTSASMERSFLARTNAKIAIVFTMILDAGYVMVMAALQQKKRGNDSK